MLPDCEETGWLFHLRRQAKVYASAYRTRRPFLPAVLPGVRTRGDDEPASSGRTLSSGVTGLCTPAKALEKVLADTGVMFQFIAPNAVMLDLKGVSQVVEVTEGVETMPTIHRDYGIPWLFNGPAPVNRTTYYGFETAN